MASVFQVNHI